MNPISVVKHLLLISFFSVFLAGCGGSDSSDADQGAVEQPDESTDLAFEFSITAHPDNVLMAIAEVSADQGISVAIQIESSGIETRQTATRDTSQQHQITLMGLRPQTEYRFSAVIESADGEQVTSDPITFTTASLPFELPQMQLLANEPQSAGGVTLFSVAGENARFIGVDEAGEPVWYLHNEDLPLASNSPALRQLDDGNLLIMLRNQVAITTLAGEVLVSYQLPNYHHEAILLDNGNVMVLVNETAEFAGNLLQGDGIQEYNREGELVWQWSSFDHLDVERFPGNLSTRVLDNGAFDWTHSNALFYRQDTDSILLSSRSQSWVIDIDYATGNINWIMGSADGVAREDLHDKFLTLSEGSWMASQHTPMIAASGQILIYDNRNESEFPGAQYNSRAVAFQLDSNNKTASQTWEYVVDKYTQALGDIDELLNGNRLLTAGGPGSTDDALLVEVTADNPAQKVWELKVLDNRIYRSERISWDSLLN